MRNGGRTDRHDKANNGFFAILQKFLKTWNLAMNLVSLVTRAARLILRVENCATCTGVQSVVDFSATYVTVITETKRFSSKHLYILKEMP
jgi:hypothetical protein